MTEQFQPHHPVEIIYPKRRTTRKLFKNVTRQATPPGSGTLVDRVEDGTEEIYFSVQINIDEIDGMARQAARNKSQNCRDGALTVKILSRRKL